MKSVKTEIVSPTLFESGEMTTKEKQEQTAPNEEISEDELSAPRWSVVSFESVAVSSLSYDEAVKWMKKLGKQKVSGLCIITDEAAARISN